MELQHTFGSTRLVVLDSSLPVGWPVIGRCGWSFATSEGEKHLSTTQRVPSRPTVAPFKFPAFGALRPVSPILLVGGCCLVGGTVSCPKISRAHGDAFEILEARGLGCRRHDLDPGNVL